MKHDTTITAEIKSRISFDALFREYYPENCSHNGNALCPWHDDTTPSLNLKQTAGFCYGACATENRSSSDPGGHSYDIFNLHMLRFGCEFKTALAQLGDRAGVTVRKRGTNGPGARIVAAYDYTDEAGKLLFQAVRTDPKGFKQRRPDPDRPDEWIWNLKGVQAVLFHLPTLSDAEEIWIPEGEKDVLRLESLGFTATTSPMGAGKWGKICANGQPPDVLRGKRILIIQDNDGKAQKFAGQKHAKQVARSLHGFAATVKILDLTKAWSEIPEKGDVSDVIDHRGPDVAKHLLLKLAESTAAYLPELDLAPPPPDDQRAVHQSFLPLPYVDQIRNETTVIAYDGRIYRYGQGVYQEWKPEEIDKQIISLIGPGVRGRQVDEIRKLLQSVCYVPPETVNPLGIMNLNNGLLDLDTGALSPHTHEYLSTLQLPIALDPNADCPVFEQFLKEKIPDSSLQQLVQEIAGYLLVPTTKFQTAFVLVGRERTGKSTFLKIFTALVGMQNIAHVPLDRIGDRFQTCLIDGKLVNFCSEVAVGAFLQDGILKAVVTGDDIQGEQKHKQPYSFRPYCRIVAACNELPLSRDVGDPFFRRWTIIPMNVTHTVSDLTIEDRIIGEEMSGVLLWALAGLARLNKNGGFTGNQASFEALEAWRLQIDPVREFARRCLRQSADSRIPLKVVYTAFRGWSQETGRKIDLSDSGLKRRLENLGMGFRRGNMGQILWGYSLEDDADAVQPRQFGDAKVTENDAKVTAEAT